MSQDGIRDARTLGKPKMLLLGFQHTFAIVGADGGWCRADRTPVATTLLMRGWERCCFTC